MQSKQLGQSDLYFSRIGLGTWAMGGGGWRYGWGAQDDKDSIRTIQHALDLGINWIDTAPVYGLGHSEEVVGKALRGIKQRPFVATKCGRTWSDPMTIGSNLKRDFIKQEAEESIKRLGGECIDLYQIHWPKPEADLEEAWRAIDELIREGKVRYAGVSNCDVAQLEMLGKIYPVTSLQPPYSMIKRDGEAAIFPYCAQHHIGIVSYSPMHKGLLSGKFDAERIRQLAADDHRREDSRFREPEFSINLALIAKLQALAEKRGRTMAQLAIAWALHREEITSVIVGGRKPEQLDELVKISDWQLTASFAAEIDKLLNEHELAVQAVR